MRSYARKQTWFVLAALCAGACSIALAQESGHAPTKYPNQVFLPTDNGNLEWDLFIPAPPAAPPWNVVLVIHEGNFNGGTRRDVDYVAEELAKQGFAAAAIDYRVDEVPSTVDGQTVGVFAPPATPNQPGDVQAAIMAARFPTMQPLVDSKGKSLVTGWVGLVGGSTGASHALWCAATGTVHDTKPNVVALLSGPYLFTDRNSLTDNTLLGCTLDKSSFAKDVITYCQTTVKDRHRTNILMEGSPWTIVNKDVSPLIAFGTMSDPITPYQLQDLQALLKRHGLLDDTANYSVNPLTGSDHGFQYWDGSTGCSGTPPVMAQVVSFLNAHLTEPNDSP